MIRNYMKNLYKAKSILLFLTLSFFSLQMFAGAYCIGLDQPPLSCRTYGGILCHSLAAGTKCVGGSSNNALWTGCGCCGNGYTTSKSDGNNYCNK